MRIALIYDGVYPYSVGGGEKVFRDLALFLGDQHEVHLLGMKLWNGADEMTLAPNVYLHGICLPERENTLQAGASRSLASALHFARATYRTLMQMPRFDLVDCMATPYFPLYAARLACWRRETVLVSTWLELWERAHWREYLGSALKASIASRVESWAIGLPRHIVSISEQTAEGLLGRGLPAERLTVIAPWIDHDAIQAVEPGVERCDVLYAGRLISSKGVDQLIRAVAQLKARFPEVRCRIVGDGPERERLQALARELSVEANVDFSGFLPEHRDLIAAMKASQVFVLPSRREGFGIVVVEAAACGVPTVTIETDNNAARNLVRESGCGAVCADEPRDLARAVGALLERTGQEMERDGVRARAWAKQFDWTVSAREYASVYEAAVS